MSRYTLVATAMMLRINPTLVVWGLAIAPGQFNLVGMEVVHPIMIKCLVLVAVGSHTFCSTAGLKWSEEEVAERVSMMRKIGTAVMMHVIMPTVATVVIINGGPIRIMEANR
jgi:hypothetical protein